MINRRMEICSLVIYVYDRQAVHLVSLDFPLFTKDRERERERRKADQNIARMRE